MEIANRLVEARLTTLESWQSALGRAVESMPPWPIGPEPLTDPPSSMNDSELQTLLPVEVLRAWTAPMDPSQVEFGRAVDGFTPGYHGAVMSTSHDPQFWWTIPEYLAAGRTGLALRTTRGPWLGAPCVIAFGEEDPFFDSPWANEDSGVDPGALAASLGLVWRRLECALPSPRVLEITVADDWVALTNAFPQVIDLPPHRRGHSQTGGPWREWFPEEAHLVKPDWGLVAREYDAVHLTQFAYVTAAYARLNCEHGFTTVSGWGPDQTRWLRDPRPAI